MSKISNAISGRCSGRSATSISSRSAKSITREVSSDDRYQRVRAGGALDLRALYAGDVRADPSMDEERKAFLGRARHARLRPFGFSSWIILWRYPGIFIDSENGATALDRGGSIGASGHRSVELR